MTRVVPTTESQAERIAYMKLLREKGPRAIAKAVALAKRKIRAVKAAQ